jgi:hypothetical protein
VVQHTLLKLTHEGLFVLHLFLYYFFYPGNLIFNFFVVMFRLLFAVGHHLYCEGETEDP